MIDIRQLSYQYSDGTNALNSISLEINRGEKVAILGQNGSGKSTLFLCLTGVLKAGQGEIVVDGKKIEYSKKGLLALRKKIGIVFQDPEMQLFCTDVLQEVSFGPLNLGYTKEEARNMAEESLRQVDGETLKRKPPHFLSYGQKKRVAIASVLSMNPETMIFDEPTAGLDPFHSKQVMMLLEDLHKQGKTLILSTHDAQLAYQWAERVILLQEGKVVTQGTSVEVFSNEQLLEQVGFEQPMILRMYKQLSKINMVNVSQGIPKNMEQLESLIGK